MKKNLKTILAAAAVLFASCQNEQMVSDSSSDQTTHASDYVATTESYDAQTKTSLDSEGNVLWKTGDQLTVFDGNTTNRKFQVTDDSNGKTSANLDQITGDGYTAGTELPANIAYYPYSSTNEVRKNGETSYNVTVTLPATQAYAENSFGNGSFPMVAVTTGTSDKNLTFKNVLGGLKLQLKGTVAIRSISVTGNNDEILYGAAAVTASNGSNPTIVLSDASAKTVTLDCGESGVQLNAETATNFVISLPPMILDGGFTIELTNTLGEVQRIKTEKSQTISRSNLLKMPELTANSFIAVQPSNIIYYTTTDEQPLTGRVVESKFGAKLLSNVYENGRGVLEFDSPIRSIASFAIYSSELKSISIPSSVLSIDPDFLGGNNYRRGLERFEGVYASADGRCLIMDKTLIAFAGKGLTEYSTPSGIRTIGTNAFSGSNLSYLTISEGVTRICEKAFNGSNDKGYVLLPKSLTNTDENAFYYLTLPAITVPENVETIDYRIFDAGIVDVMGNTPATILGTPLNRDKPIYVPKGTIEAYRTAWSSVSNRLIEKDDQPLNEIWFTTVDDAVLTVNHSGYNPGWPIKVLEKNNTKIVFAAPIDEISYLMFESSNMKSVTLPKSIKRLGNNCFQESPYLEEVNLNDGLKELSWFSLGKTAIESIVIPESVEYMNACFNGCAKLKSVKLPSKLKYLGTVSYSSSLAPGVGPGSDVFYGCTLLTDIDLPESLVYIGDGCFQNCEQISDIAIPEGVTFIGYSAFSGTGISTITIPSGVTSIEGSCFYNCKNLVEVLGIEQVTQIGSSAFKKCVALEEFVIPDAVTKIESWTFEDCSSLRRIDLPKSLQEIKLYAFNNCKQLTEIHANSVSYPKSSDEFEAKDGVLYVPAGSGSVYANWLSSSSFAYGSSWSIEEVESDDSDDVLNVTSTTTINTNSQWLVSTKQLTGYDVYMSDSNTGMHSSWASMKITFKGQPNFKLYINSYAESTYDYTIAWNIDTNVPTSLPSSSSTGVKAHTSGKQYNPTSISNFTEVSYPNDGGEHFVWITYRKDSSDSDNDDRGYVAIPEF